MQEFAGSVAAQLAFDGTAKTVTVPDGVKVSPEGGVTENVTVTFWSTIAGFDDSDRIAVDGVACVAVPTSRLACVEPGPAALSSVKKSDALKMPVAVGVNTTDSEQCAPGASGDAATQFCVAVKGCTHPLMSQGLTATLVTVSGAVPVLVRVTD